jgi:hypothetical protein
MNSNAVILSFPERCTAAKGADFARLLVKHPVTTHSLHKMWVAGEVSQVSNEVVS